MTAGSQPRPRSWRTIAWVAGTAISVAKNLDLRTAIDLSGLEHLAGQRLEGDERAPLPDIGDRDEKKGRGRLSEKTHGLSDEGEIGEDTVQPAAWGMRISCHIAPMVIGGVSSGRRISVRIRSLPFTA